MSNHASFHEIIVSVDKVFKKGSVINRNDFKWTNFVHDVLVF